MKPFVLGPQEQSAADEFQAFYLHLSAIRDAILTTVSAAEDTTADAEGAPEVRPIALDSVRTRLARAITDLGYRPGDPAATGAVDPGYVMTAVADEVLLMRCPAWASNAAWTDDPLESVLYGSRLAGDRLFAAADDLIAGRREDARTATVILLALLGGFRGRYQGRADQGNVARITAGLYKIVCHRPYAADDAAPYASPDLAATTLPGSSNRPLPALWPWAVALLMIVLVYLPASHALWWSGVASVSSLANTIIEDSENPRPLSQGQP